MKENMKNNIRRKNIISTMKIYSTVVAVIAFVILLCWAAVISI